MRKQAALWVLPVLVVGVVVLADNNPATDQVKRMVGYQGWLDRDGVPVSGPVDLVLGLYADDTSPSPIYRQCFSTTASAGRFHVVLGPQGVTGGDGVGCAGTPVSLATVIADANDLHVGVSVSDRQAGLVALRGRQRILPVPYTFWATEAADFRVNQDLTVVRNAAVSGTLTAGALALNGNLGVTGNVQATGSVSGRTLGGTYTPPYDVWGASPAVGAGGAAIYNEGTNYKALMIVGNDSAGAGLGRKIGMWDDVSVARNLDVAATTTTTYATVTQDLTVRGNQVVNQNLTVLNRHLPNYDSDWVYYTNATHQDVALPHGFGFIPSRVLLQACGHMVSGQCQTRVVMVTESGYRHDASYVNPMNITADTNNIYVAIAQNAWMYGYWDKRGGLAGWDDPDLSNAWYRVLAWK
jgi:hypothetical protein